MQQSDGSISAGQQYRRYDGITVDGSGVNIFGDVGTLLPSQPGPAETIKCGLCLGAAPQIDPTYFVGRATEIKEMSQILELRTGCTRQRRVILGGIGGVGKTQLALAYAERHQESYDSIFWLNATSELTLHLSLRLVAGRIVKAQDLDDLGDEQVLVRVHEWLSHPYNTRWLLIFDNHDEPAAFKINKYCPYASHGSVIITTRLPDHVDLSSDRIRVQPLVDINESLDILQKRCRRPNVKDDPDARRLAQRLAGLPLALTTAAAYLSKKASITFHQYLQAYEQRWDIDPRRPLQLQEYQDRTLYTTWNLSYARLANDDPEAADLLKLLAYVDNEDIWYGLLGAGIVYNSPPRLQRSLSSLIDFENTMTTLVDYCFVEVQTTTQSYSMHNCVHDWTLAELNKNHDQRLYRYAFNCVAASLNHDDNDDWGSYGYLKYARLTSHAVRLVHPWFSPTLLLDEVDVDWTHDALHIARLLRAQIQLSAAERMYLRALAGTEKAPGSNHDLTLYTVHNLGMLYDDQGRLDEAEQMYLRALTGRERALGPDHTSTLDTVHNLGLLYTYQDKLDGAEQMYLRALAGYEKVLRPDHTSTLKTLFNLGELYIKQDRLKEAESTLKRALAGFEKALGSDHTSTLQTQHQLANLCRQQNKLDEAESLYLQVLVGYEMALGDDHPLTMRLVHHFGLLYEKQDRREEAEEMYRRALAGYQKRLGLKHSHTQGVADDLDKLLAKIGYKQ